MGSGNPRHKGDAWGLGAIPAYDYFLKVSFRYLGENRREQAAFNYPSERSLGILADFYAEHAEEVDELADRLRTGAFLTGQSTDQPVTRMKVIDMFGFRSGSKPQQGAGAVGFVTQSFRNLLAASRPPQMEVSSGDARLLK